MNIREYVIREGVPLLISGTEDGCYIDHIAAVTYVPAEERVIPLQRNDGFQWYPDCHRIIFWIDSGDHTMENRKVLAVGWNVDDPEVSFEQIGETVVQNWRSRASKLYDHSVLPAENMVWLPLGFDDSLFEFDWKEIGL